MVETATYRRPAPPVAPPAAPPVAATVAPDRGPSIDTDRVADLQRGLSPATLAPLMEQCLAEISERLARLHEFVRQGDARATEQGAHALAGLAASYGVAGLERQMRRVIAAAQAGDLAEASRHAQNADAELACAAADLRALLQPIAA
jgi:hypothetical protein